MENYTQHAHDLERFRNDVRLYFENRRNQDVSQIRDRLTKESTKIRRLIIDANIATQMSGRAAPAAGGFPYSFDIINDMFNNEGTPYAVSKSLAVDTLNKAIGVYEDWATTGEPRATPSELIQKTKPLPSDNTNFKVTIPWLIKHVSVTGWFKIFGSVTAFFLAGVYFSGIPFAKDILPLIPGYKTQRILPPQTAAHLENQLTKLIDSYNLRLSRLNEQLLSEEKMAADQNLISSYQAEHLNAAQRLRVTIREERLAFEKDVEVLKRLAK